MLQIDNNNCNCSTLMSESQMPTLSFLNITFLNIGYIYFVPDRIILYENISHFMQSYSGHSKSYRSIWAIANER